MKKHILTSLIILSASFSYAQTNDKNPTVFDEKNVYSYHLVKKELVGDKSMDKILTNYYREYMKRLKKINKDMDSYYKDIESQINRNIKEGEKNILMTKNLYDKNCTHEIKEEETHNQCQGLQESMFNDKESIKNMENEKINFKGQIEVDRKNRLKALYTNYKNLSGKSKAEYEAKK